MAGLGRGLSALLSENQKQKQQQAELLKQSSSVTAANPVEKPAADKNSLVQIRLEELRPSAYQPRQNFNEQSLDELAASIREHGLLEPLLVKRASDRYEIICGERRFRAAKIAGLKTVPCIIYELENKAAYAVALIENLQREDLNPIEQAEALQLMMTECGLTQSELSDSIGIPRSGVANLLRLNYLENQVKALVAGGRLSSGHAKVLLALTGDEQVKAADHVVSSSLSVRKTEELVQDLLQGEKGDKIKPKPDPDLTRQIKGWEDKLSSSLKGAKIKISVSAADKGRITLNYASAEQLQAIKACLGID